MTDLEKWKEFLTEQGVGFEQQSCDAITPQLWLSGDKVRNFWAGCVIYFNDDGSLKEIEVSE